MNNDLYREYRFKFYLNANHFIIIDGKEGQTHPHTWEFIVSIAIDKNEFVQFDSYERAIEEYFKQYQNTVINTKKPFNLIIPTLENMAEYFVEKLQDIVKEMGGQLMQLEMSETPTRSYVLNLENRKDYMEHMKDTSKKKMDSIVDQVLDNVLKD